MDAILVIFFIIAMIVMGTLKPGMDAKNFVAATGKRRPSPSYKKAHKEFGHEDSTGGNILGDLLDSAEKALDKLTGTDDSVLSGSSNKNMARRSTDATHQTARYASAGYDTQNLDFCDSFISRSRGISFSNRPANMDELTYLAKCNAQREKEIETQMKHKHFDE